ncbi:MAG: adenylate kinase [Acidiferrobacter sp.]
MRIVLLGAPGSGKGTQSKLLVDKYRVPQISTGDLLRAAVSAGTELGRRAKAAMDSGQLVTDDIVLGMIQERLSRPDAKAGFILDGFPRNNPQAQALDSLLARLGQPLQLALLVDVDNEVLLKRLTGRRTCATCGQMYNVYFSPPKTPGVCDKCNGTLQHRSDDNETTIRKRLEVYEQQTAPLISYYRMQNKLRTVRGVGNIQDIAREVTSVIEQHIHPLSSMRPATAPATAVKPKATDAAKTAAPAAKAPETATPKKAAPKKAVAKKSMAKAAVKTTAVKKKGVTKKKVAAKKKTVTKKKVAAKKKTVTKKKVAAKKKTVTKKKVAAKKKTVTKKKVAAKKKTRGHR